MQEFFGRDNFGCVIIYSAACLGLARFAFLSTYGTCTIARRRQIRLYCTQTAFGCQGEKHVSCSPVRTPRLGSLGRNAMRCFSVGEAHENPICEMAILLNCQSIHTD